MNPDLGTPRWWHNEGKGQTPQCMYEQLVDKDSLLKNAKASLRIAEGVITRLNKESECLSARLDGALADARGSQKDTDTYWKKRAKRAEAELRTNLSSPALIAASKTQIRALEERITSLVQSNDQTSSENVDVKKYNNDLYKANFDLLEENGRLKEKLQKIPLLVEATNAKGTTDVGLAKESRIQNVAIASYVSAVAQTGFRWVMPVTAVAVVAAAVVSVLTAL